MNKNKFKKIVFIYNANSGVQTALLDGAHKILSPGTYQCNLCDLTYGVFTEDRLWKKFRMNSDLEMVFLHRDEFQKEYASKFIPKYTYPIILLETEYDLDILVNTTELNELTSSQELISVIGERTAPKETP
jgi:hypothetical protein